MTKSAKSAPWLGDIAWITLEYCVASLVATTVIALDGVISSRTLAAGIFASLIILVPSEATRQFLGPEWVRAWVQRRNRKRNQLTEKPPICEMVARPESTISFGDVFVQYPLICLSARTTPGVARTLRVPFHYGAGASRGADMISSGGRIVATSGRPLDLVAEDSEHVGIVRFQPLPTARRGQLLSTIK
jgi:hypothetical protein